jgi:hypothetical protein
VTPTSVPIRLSQCRQWNGGGWHSSISMNSSTVLGAPSTRGTATVFTL